MNHPFTSRQLFNMIDRVYNASGPDAADNPQFLAFRGSVAHGTYVPDTDPNSIDDVDLMGFVIPGVENYLGLSQWGSRGTREIKDGELDVVLYDLQKLFRLLVKSNPNVLSLLFVPDQFVLLTSDIAETLRENAHLFLSQDAYHPFVGYAHGQLSRMTRFSTKGYMGERRKRLVEEFGFDSKNGAHCIRLLRIGEELLRTGEFNVWRPDAEELLDIKRGGWSLGEVQAEADRMFKLCRRAKDNSPLPPSIDVVAVEELCVRLMMEGLGLRK